MNKDQHGLSKRMDILILLYSFEAAPLSVSREVTMKKNLSVIHRVHPLRKTRSNLKAFTDNKRNMTLCTVEFVSRLETNMVLKEETAAYQHFPLSALQFLSYL